LTSKFLLAFAIASATPALAAPQEIILAEPVCGMTRIRSIGARLDGSDPRQVGSAVSYSNGIYGVDYRYWPSLHSSRVGDAVELCMIRAMHGCPRGDERGRTYRARNLRTGQVWEMPNSTHTCGGA